MAKSKQGRRDALKKLALAPFAGMALFKQGPKEDPKRVYICEECGDELETEGDICEECYTKNLVVSHVKKHKRKETKWSGYSAVSMSSGVTCSCREAYPLLR
jgi:predicted amidophosphoribosyltransferase